MKEILMRAILTALALSLAVPMAACSRDASEAENAATIPVTIEMAGQSHRFDVEVARTDAEQDRGLMFRNSLPENGGKTGRAQRREIVFLYVEESGGDVSLKKTKHTHSNTSSK